MMVQVPGLADAEPALGLLSRLFCQWRLMHCNSQPLMPSTLGEAVKNFKHLFD